jgi:hypothetical protein
MHVSDGSQYDVLHHDFVFVTKRHVRVAVGVPTVDDFLVKTVNLDSLRIARIEALETTGNG